MLSMNIPADDATLAEALESANLPALLPAIVQLTGDTSLLTRFPPPSAGMMGAVEGNFPPEEPAAIRALETGTAPGGGRGGHGVREEGGWEVAEWRGA